MEQKKTIRQYIGERRRESRERNGKGDAVTEARARIASRIARATRRRSEVKAMP